jgi:hypothetical protein
LPFRHRTLRQRGAEVDDDRGDRLARRPGLMNRLGPALILTVSRPVTVSGRVDRGDGELIGGHAMKCTGDQPRRLLVHAAGVPRQQQW